ncbi:MAG: hypothetical protein K6A90_08620 [Lachnospiraceae bacterium]|nr:hypothetical protein [Lachnospiraceae bacterium]
MNKRLLTVYGMAHHFEMSITMKLTGKLKKQVEKAQTKEEAREAIKKAGMLLDDDELELVSGGGMEKTEDKFPRIYCEGKYHEMVRIYPYSVRYNGKVYKNMERYLCSSTMRSFYTTNEGGVRCIYNDKMELYSRG